MEISYKVEHRNVKYPRLEFKGLTLLVVLPREIESATEILEKRKPWIQKKWTIIQESLKNVSTPHGFMIFGEPFTIENTYTQKPIIDTLQRKIQTQIGNPEHQKIIKQQLKNLLEQKLRTIIKEYSKKTGLKPDKLIINQQKTKWGSCSNKKNISFNLKLVCLPNEIIKYVVFHEMLHLKEKKHSFSFWQKIGKEFPDYKGFEKKLLEYWFYTEILFLNLAIKTSKATFT
jgi:hypothetical protein